MTALRKRTELMRLSEQELDAIVKQVARARIIGSFFIGKFHEQSVTWGEDGVAVTTEYTEGTLEDHVPFEAERKEPRVKRKYQRRRA